MSDEFTVDVKLRPPRPYDGIGDQLAAKGFIPDIRALARIWSRLLAVNPRIAN